MVGGEEREQRASADSTALPTTAEGNSGVSHPAASGGCSSLLTTCSSVLAFVGQLCSFVGWTATDNLSNEGLGRALGPLGSEPGHGGADIHGGHGG